MIDEELDHEFTKKFIDGFLKGIDFGVFREYTRMAISFNHEQELFALESLSELLGRRVQKDLAFIFGISLLENCLHKNIVLSLEELRSKTIDFLDLNVKEHNCLINNNIKTVGQILDKTYYDLLRLRGFGEKGATLLKIEMKSQLYRYKIHDSSVKDINLFKTLKETSLMDKSLV